MVDPFLDDPAVSGRRIWQRSSAAGMLLGFAGVCGLAGGVGFNLISITAGSAFNLILVLVQLVSMFIIAMSLFLLKEAHSKRGGYIAIEDQNVLLDLPAGRSRTVQVPAVSVIVPFEDLQAIETRLERFEVLFFTDVQRAYRLRLRAQPAILLFEERVVDPQVNGALQVDESFQVVAAQVATRAGVPLDDLGIVEGRFGVFGLFSAAVPPWPAAPLTKVQQWSRRTDVGRMAVLVVAAALIESAIRLFLQQ